MGIIKCGFLACLLAASLAAGGTGGQSLKLAALDPIMKSGTQVIVAVTTTNESNDSITYHNTRPSCDYSVTVRTSPGASAAETEFKKKLDCAGGTLPITGRDIVVTLKPGESDREQLEITELCDMSPVGEYTVLVERTFPGIGHFRSNPAKVKLTP